MSDTKTADPCKVITGEFRLSFPALFEPKAMEGSENAAKYSLVMLIPHDAPYLAKMKDAAKAAVRAKWGDKPPGKLRSPFRNGDDPNEGKQGVDGYAGMVFVSASSKDRPGVIDQAKQAIEKDDRRLFAGCYCRASVRAFAYDRNGNKGVAFGLQNVQLLRTGQPFGNKRAAEDEFDAVAADPAGGDDPNF